MIKLENKELLSIIGGKVSASLINSVFRGASLILELGRSLGTAIRRITSRKSCSL